MTVLVVVTLVLVGLIAFVCGQRDERRRLHAWHDSAGWTDLERVRRDLATAEAVIRAQLEHRELRESAYRSLLERWKAEQATNALLQARLCDVALTLDRVVAWVDAAWPHGIGDAHDSDYHEVRLDARISRAIRQAHAQADAPLGEVAA